MNASLDRWIKSSLAKHFSSLSEHLHVEGAHRQTEELEKWFELRIWRISKKQRTKNSWNVFVDIDIACMCIHTNNAYLVEDLSGEAESKMLTSLPLYQYDEAITLPITQLSCFDRVIDPEVIPLGEVKPGLKLFQTNVTSQYEVRI
jgi:hypothetical protein